MSGCEQKQTMLERAVLGSVIMGDVLPSGLELEAQHFGDPLCRQVFETLCRMEKHRQEIDLPGVCMADETLDAQAIVEMTSERCVSEVLIRQHCDQLRERAVRRTLEALLSGTQAALAAGGDAAEQIDALRTKLGALMETTAPQTGAGSTMLDLILMVLAQMEKREEAQEAIATGIEKIDECLSGGVRPGDLTVVAGLTSVGKSAMLAFMMRNAAEQGKRILLISCEMSDEQNAERYMAAISGTPLDVIIRREALTEEQNIRLCDGMERYKPENIRVISSGTQTVSSVRREALRMKLSMGLDMVVVDYLQRLRPERGTASRAEDVGAIASGLKSLAVDLDVPVLTAAQFNREAARARNDALGKVDEGIPALHQLRDSSQIEDEANTVIILDEPKRERGAHTRSINAYIAKNRSGRLGAVRLLFDGQTMRYTMAQDPSDPEGEKYRGGTRALPRQYMGGAEPRPCNGSAVYPLTCSEA